MTEKPAKDVSGRFLYDPRTNRYWFRVYGEADSTGKKTWIDYDLAAEDIRVTISSTSLSLYEGDKNRLDWSSDVLKPKIKLR